MAFRDWRPARWTESEPLRWLAVCSKCRWEQAESTRISAELDADCHRFAYAGQLHQLVIVAVPDTP